MPKFDDRFARQNRYEPPPEFPLASPYSGIVHHLSGPNIRALPQIRRRRLRSGRRCPPRQRSQLSLSLRARVCHPNTRRHVRLLGPCFKTGRLRPLCQHPQRERGRNPAFRHAAFISPNHHIRPRAITHPKVPHSFGLFLAIKTDVGPSTRKYTQQCQADPQPTRLTSNVSLSTISHTV